MLLRQLMNRAHIGFNYHTASNALVKDPPVSHYHISDHWSVTFLLTFDKPLIIRKTKTFRKIKNIDTAALSNKCFRFV